MNQMLKLIIFLSVCCVAHGQCNGLIVYDGNTKLNTSLVCIKQYKSAECNAYYQSFNRSDLPGDFLKNGSSVLGPNTVSVVGIESLKTIAGMDYMYPGLSVRWTPPDFGANRDACYGYLVTWVVPNGSTNMCQLFYINKMPQETLRFQYDIPAVNQNALIDVRVYSMPRDGPQDKENEQAFKSKKVKTPVAYKPGTPSDWSPFVMYDIFDNGTVLVSVSLPPRDFNITDFDIYLQRNGSSSAVVVSKHYSAQLRTETVTDFSTPLTANESGSYSVVVWVKDKFQMVDGQCECWAWMNNKKTCKAACGGTQTNVFYVNITNPPMTTHPVTTPTKNPNSTPENQNDEPIKIIIGVVVPIVLLILIIICVCLFRNKSKVKFCIERLRRCFPNEQVISGHERRPGDLSHEGNIPSLSRKTIYLISADDHEAHVGLIKALASFLEVHCHCNVILPSQSNHYDTGAYHWFLSNITKSDFILFVNSEGALKMIEAYLDNKSYMNRRVGPDGDLFIISLKHILCSNEVREKSLILVSFHGSHCQKFLQVPHVFKLPNHLRHLLQKIHRLDESTISSYSNILPLNDGNIKELPEGADMLSAWKDVKSYEERNPWWFEMNFGSTINLRPPYERVLSIDSGITPDRLDSISQQGSSPSSPTADCDLPSGRVPLIYPSIPFVNSDKVNDKDAFSCYTIKEGRERMEENVQRSGLDDFPIIPPESASHICYESISTALANVNNHDYEATDTDLYQIIPPLNPQDIQLESVSSALADINATSDNFFQS